MLSHTTICFLVLASYVIIISNVTWFMLGISTKVTHLGKHGHICGGNESAVASKLVGIVCFTKDVQT